LFLALIQGKNLFWKKSFGKVAGKWTADKAQTFRFKKKLNLFLYL
jgi:hypothetical protein